MILPRSSGSEPNTSVAAAPERPAESGRSWLLLAWALMVLLVATVAYALFDRQRDELVAQRHDQLWRTVTQKVTAVETWRDERIADTEHIARNDSFKRLLGLWMNGQDVSRALPALMEDLGGLLASGRYEGIFLLDSQGRLRLNVGQFPDDVGRFKGLTAQVLALDGPVLSDFEIPYGPSAGQVRLNLMAPLRAGGKMVGILGVQINPYPYFLPLLQSWPAETKTAETVLVERSDHTVVFVRQLRFGEGIATGAELNPLSHEGILGEPGQLLEGPDYRGEPVIAVAQVIPGTPWMLVAKIDRAEFYAPMRELAAMTAGIALLVILLLSGLILVWRRKDRNRRAADWYEQQLRRQLMSAHFDYLAKYANDIILLVDENGRIIESNDRALEAYRISREVMLQTHWDDLRAIFVLRPLEERWAHMRERNALVFESWHRRADGAPFPVEISGRMIQIGGRSFFQAIIRDITERKEYQHRILRLRDMYAALSQTNQAIMRCRDIESLFRSICHVAVTYGHFQLAWIGMVNAAARVVVPVAHAGRHGEFFSGRVFPLDPERPGGDGPTARAVREGQVSVCNDIQADPTLTAWRDIGRRYGMASMAAMPLMRGQTVVGAMTVYAAQTQYFDRQLIALLQEMALDIAFALDAQEQEKKRREAERTLSESESRYRQLFDNMSAGVAVFEAGQPGEPFVFKDANRALGAIEHVDHEALPGKEVEKSFPELKKTGLIDVLEQVRRTGEPTRQVITLFRRGRPPGYRDTYVYRLQSGEIVAVYDDITEQRRADEALRSNEQRLSLVLQATNDGFWDYDFTTGYVYYSPRWLELLGYTAEEVGSSPESWARLVHPDDVKRAWRKVVHHLAGRTDHFSDEYRMRAKSGEWRWILSRGKVVRRDEQGHPLRLTGTHTDITERKRAEEKLRLWAMVFRNSGEGIFITDARRRIVSANRAFTQITGYTAEEVQGRDPALLRSGEHDLSFYQNMWAGIDQSGYWQGEIWNRRKNGEVYPQWTAISAVRDPAGEILNYITVFSDISEQKAAEERIRYLAHHDFLTGLPNRSALQDRMDVVLAHARRIRKQVAVLFVDLDRFKNINDSLGHHVGDELLKEVARRLKGCVRDEDTVCRLGGDEFIVALSEVEDADAAAHIAGKIIDSVSRPYHVAAMELRITPSMGISMFPEDGGDINRLIRNADAAMYLAKERGRNNFQFFTPELNARTFKRLSLENSMRRALEIREFTLHYQPQIDLRTGAVTGVEALLRWRRDHEVVSAPAEFIPVAEESGLIVPLGRWVLTEACRQQRLWSEQGMSCLTVAVNISALQFRQKDFGHVIREVLEETGIDPTRLDIELTEGMLMSEAESNIGLLKELKEMGISVSVDDFGTGYSSLSYLRRFPIDRIKVDQSFVRDLASDAADRAITGAIIGLGKSLGLRVIAEGVETEEELSLLQAHQCEHVQGNYFSRPLEPADFERWILHSGRAPQCLPH